MKLNRRKVAIVAGAFIALVVVLVAVVHHPAVQRSVWNRLATAIEESSGWQIAAEDLALLALPARFRASGVTVGYEGRTVVSLDRLEARWAWLGALRAPHRLDLLVLEGVEINADALPEPQSTTGDPAISVWELVEIGELRVLGVGGSESISGIEVVVDGLNIDARLVSGLATARVTTEKLSVVRDGRLLDLGSIDVEGNGSREGVRVDRLALDSNAIGMSVTGEMVFSPATGGRFEVSAGIDTETVAEWWDPNMATGLEPSGRLELDGHVSFTDAGGIELELSHRGQPMRVVGYDIETLDLSFEDGRPTVHVGHPGWGEATVTMTAPGIADLSAVFDQAPIDRLLAFTAPHVAAELGQPATLTGTIVGTVSYPILPEFLSGRFELEMRSPLGRFDVQAEGAGYAWRVARLDGQAAGATLRASGAIEEDGTVLADASLDAVEPRRVAESLARWFPAMAGLAIDGGPIEVRARIGGSLAAPDVIATVKWAEPVIGGQRVESLAAEASGGLDELDWKLTVLRSPVHVAHSFRDGASPRRRSRGRLGNAC